MYEVVSIEGGCIHLGGYTYRYNWTDNAGEHIIVFDAPVPPKIGDWIDEGGNFHRREDWKINHDTSRWQTQPYDDTWPNAR